MAFTSDKGAASPDVGSLLASSQNGRSLHAEVHQHATDRLLSEWPLSAVQNSKWDTQNSTQA